jgi:Ca-activated chloride channel homolog
LKSTWVFRICALGLLAGAPLRGQSAGSAQSPPTAQTPDSAQTNSTQSSDITTIKVQTRLVAVSAIVHDKAGRPVGNLTRDAFLLKQDGKPQQIRYFSQGSDLPLTLALMVDTSGSQNNYILNEMIAGRVFFRSMMQKPDDRAVLVQFDTNILQLAKLTNDETTLEHALAYLAQSHDDIRHAGRGMGGTLLYDAICATSKIDFGNRLGRRAMVILTDGDDHGSQYSERRAIEDAQRADIVIYSVYYSNGGGNLGVLNDLSRATGGRVFQVSETLTLEEVYAQIADDMRLQYQLGYEPPDTRPDKFHKIELTAKEKGLTVQAREGYFTPK